MATGSLHKTDLNAVHGIVQNTMMSFAKALFIETLRDEFSKDSYYSYRKDAFGFPNTRDLTGTNLEAGIEDEVTSRIFIGEAFHYDMKFFPAVLVRSGGFKYVPIGLSRNEDLVKYKSTRVIDGYGNVKIFTEPSYISLSGAWEGQVTLDIYAGDIKSRDEVAEIIAALLTITNFKSMQHAGVIVKPINISSPSEEDDARDKKYKITITCDVRTEWNQHIPIDTVVNMIAFCVDFGDLSKEPETIAPNLGISTTVDLMDVISSL